MPETKPSSRSRLVRLTLGAPDDPRWARPLLCAVLAVSAVLNTWALSINGWANTYYSATVLGMSRSWTALFFGAFDEHSFITVDKPPLALWGQALSARAFGFSSWSVLLPQALAGVLTVWVVHHVVRRSFGHVAASIAAVTLAVTPVAVAMSRHNNPDGLLVLLLALALWAASNAVRSGKLGPLVWCAVAVGLAFNTKMLHAYFVLPVIAAVYLGAVRLQWPRKWLNLGVSAVVLFLSSTFWMFAIDLTPAAARPYVGGSTNNTVRDLLVGYNGFGRVLGQSRVMAPGIMPGGGGHSGPDGPGVSIVDPLVLEVLAGPRRNSTTAGTRGDHAAESPQKSATAQSSSTPQDATHLAVARGRAAGIGGFAGFSAGAGRSACRRSRPP